MTTADVRDMLDLPSDGHPRPAKKQKTVEKRPEGITRELFALLGERAPPVAITDHIKYKERPKWSHKVQQWEITPFGNPARSDGLILRHWRRKGDPNAANTPATPAEMNTMVEMEVNSKAPQTELDYHFAKFNVKVPGPEYSEEQYETHLKCENWSKQETDYLIDLAVEYDLRWVVIADRYDYSAEQRPPGESTPSAVPPPPRSMEDMKARYYEVAAKVLELKNPLSSMSTPEFEVHEKMTKFSPTRETNRKSLANALFSRSKDELQEEEILLGELKRIVSNEERFSQERKDLYARLEAPQSVPGNTSLYQSSQGLHQLMQTLVSADKSKKRRSLVGPNGEIASSPGTGNPNQPFTSQSDRNPHRDSFSASSLKKGPLSGPSGPSATGVRQLTPREELKYGITHHERLTSGIQFRHERITKLSQAKSNIQSTKITAALTELSVPPRLVMPTAKVCNEYERLIQSIHTLLDVRKVSEKVEGETRILLAQKEQRENRGSGGDVDMLRSSPPPAAGDEESIVETRTEQTPEREDDEDADADGAADGVSVAPSTRSGGRKRSTSVASGMSGQSTRRTRK